MKGHCNTKGHTSKPHRKKDNCLNWQGTHAEEQLDLSKIEVEPDEEENVSGHMTEEMQEVRLDQQDEAEKGIDAQSAMVSETK